MPLHCSDTSQNLLSLTLMLNALTLAKYYLDWCNHITWETLQLSDTISKPWFLAVLQPHEFFHAPQPVKYPPYSLNISIAMLTVNSVEIGLQHHTGGFFPIKGNLSCLWEECWWNILHACDWGCRNGGCGGEGGCSGSSNWNIILSFMDGVSYM